jgi:hypothetical protein
VLEFVASPAEDAHGLDPTDWTARFGLRVRHVRGELQLRQVPHAQRECPNNDERSRMCIQHS